MDTRKIMFSTNFYWFLKIIGATVNVQQGLRKKIQKFKKPSFWYNTINFMQKKAFFQKIFLINFSYLKSYAVANF
jgi:hypothetical protein